ncbi:hypothetical protein [Bradyrhizobium sp. SZCCHNRI1002]|uniref:hypothetical protein n=1 Tax=Bradyrhizobium sp. SZCCHNRI1002 TaxID=3057274 RepID=UPI0028E269FB|nr:hypothetical protein [Bradyrhizobium sp. SZCCHNRI1002]
MITIRFVTSDSAVSFGIRYFSYGFWASHVEAKMPDGSLLGAHLSGGVMARAADYDKGEFSRELYVSLMASDDEADKFHAFLRSQLGRPYDTEAIAAFVARRDWKKTDSWFCSELIAAALCQCGFFPDHLATDLNHVTPRDVLLMLSSRLTIPA